MRSLRSSAISVSLAVSGSLAMFVSSGAPAAVDARQADVSGPYNVAVIPGGDVLEKPLATTPGDTWTMTFWARQLRRQAGLVRLAGVGRGLSGSFVALQDGVPVIAADGTATRPAGKAVTPGTWHRYALVRTVQGTMLSVDGLAASPGPAGATCSDCKLVFGPHADDRDGAAADIADLTLARSIADRAALSAAARMQAPDPARIQFEPSSPHWPLNIAAIQGQVVPQDARTLPHSDTPFDRPIARPLPGTPAIVARADNDWDVNGWRLAAEKDAGGDGAAISRIGLDASRWLPATVPGTVLTTLVDRGVYPDPSRGLNNLAIPYDLAHQSFWYRTAFDLPAGAVGRRLELILEGVNYSSQVWVNGAHVGDTKGAFIRGRFDVGPYLRPGGNVIAIRVSPPPHPGLAHEESLTAGVGENGGTMMLDGPTFGASEGWDWIPTIRDRNMGLWQGVHLHATGDVTIGDPQIVTTLPQADNKVADIEIEVPATNLSNRSVDARIRAGFDGVAVERTVTLAPNETRTIRFTPTTDPSLRVRDPVLWWPNGYGAPALHTLHIEARADGATADTRNVRFGMRQVTYELSLIDDGGSLDRVAYDPTAMRETGQPVIDVRHEAIRKVPGGWTFSFMPGAEHSPAVRPIAGDTGLSPFLVIRVNGVRIAVRGGAFGMDDFMKRVDRPRLEPYFRLHRDANVNAIRNWTGQSTEEVFYELADEYGLMVLNDFWESTQDYNMEAQDPQLFLANVEDMVKRYRNHPSLILYFGRNEGVPQPILNEGMDAIIRREDGTRLYVSSSNRITTHESGPWHWQPPAKYFTELSNGFAVEVGSPSFPTLESWRRTIPPHEQWPISDTWAYHDWHQAGNGAVASYTDAMNREFGPPTDLPDFERKAQMLNYESYRAIYEGMNAGLWTKNSGRLLWMTQPAWPSAMWQIFSSDYDTHAAFYGMKKAGEPVHVQMNLPDDKVMLVNNSRSPSNEVTVTARVQSIDGHELGARRATISVPPGTVGTAFSIDMAPYLQTGPVFVRLEAIDGTGRRIADNFYWRAASDEALRPLSTMPQATLDLSATPVETVPGEHASRISLHNRGAVAALQGKLTLFDRSGTQILPAFFSDNYVSLLPGESREIMVRWPSTAAHAGIEVRLRGWNVAPQVRVIGASK